MIGLIEQWREHLAVASDCEVLIPVVHGIGEAIAERLQSGGRIYACGNGGSAADSQHFATELVVAFERQRQALAAMSLCGDGSVLTAAMNDIAAESIFSRQVEAFCCERDCLVAFSTSGSSPNVLAALRAARAKGCLCVGFTGASGGDMAELCEYSLLVPSRRPARVQEMHGLLIHLLCGFIDETLGAPLNEVGHNVCEVAGGSV